MDAWSSIFWLASGMLPLITLETVPADMPAHFAGSFYAAACYRRYNQSLALLLRLAIDARVFNHVAYLSIETSCIFTDLIFSGHIAQMPTMLLQNFLPTQMVIIASNISPEAQRATTNDLGSL